MDGEGGGSTHNPTALRPVHILMVWVQRSVPLRRTLPLPIEVPDLVAVALLGSTVAFAVVESVPIVVTANKSGCMAITVGDAVMKVLQS